MSRARSTRPGLFSPKALPIANQIIDKKAPERGLFAARLARVDLPAALTIAKDFTKDREESRVVGNIAFHVTAENPAEAERLWSLTARMSRRGGMDEAICWKLAGVDPMRARRALEGMPWIDQRPDLFIYLALGSKARDELASRQALEMGMRGIDRLMKDRPERYQFLAGTILPAVERIDPALVPEILWRDVASRPPVADSRLDRGYSPVRLIAQLAWYDRNVAAALSSRLEHGWNGPTIRNWQPRAMSF